MSRIIETAYEAAVDATWAATAEVMPLWPNPGNPHFEYESGLELIDKEGTGNYATVADVRAEAKIIEVLQSYAPLSNHTFLSEECGEIAGDDEWRWIIDPIDGTPNFRNGNPDFGMCIALLRGNDPVLGVIAMPALSQLVAAREGGEARLLSFDGRELADLKTLAGRHNDNLDNALVGYDLGYANRREQLAHITRSVISKVGYATCLASFSTGNFRLLQAMMGVYFGASPTVMDVAPAAALIPSVGGVVSDMNGVPIDWRATSRSYIEP